MYSFIYRYIYISISISIIPALSLYPHCPTDADASIGRHHRDALGAADAVYTRMHTYILIFICIHSFIYLYT